VTQPRTRLARIALVTTLATALAVLAPSPAAASTTRGRMYRLTNNSRENHDVARVGLHDAMSDLARRHSVAMAKRGKPFHTSDPAGYYLDGIPWHTWGENVGVTGGTIAGLQRAFMQSNLHRANILNRGFRRVAVGTYRDADGLLWVTVFFYG
jgi:uncharacterized protein YkwD